MPYKSQKQEKFFHTKTAKEKGIGQSTVDEFDQASKGMKLPTEVSAPSVPLAPKDPMPMELGPMSKSHWRK